MYDSIRLWDFLWLSIEDGLQEIWVYDLDKSKVVYSGTVDDFRHSDEFDTYGYCTIQSWETNFTMPCSTVVFNVCENE